MWIVLRERLLLIFWILHLPISDSVPLYANKTRIAQNTENKWNSCLNPFQSSVAFHIETSHLICIANQVRFLYVMQRWGKIV